jgi:hypothetical protein
MRFYKTPISAARSLNQSDNVIYIAQRMYESMPTLCDFVQVSAPVPVAAVDARKLEGCRLPLAASAGNPEYGEDYLER